MFDEFEDFFTQGGKGLPSVDVKEIGDVCGGIVFKMELLEERDDDNKVKLNEWGKPKPLLVTWVITTLRDPMNPDDDGARRIWWKGNALWELKNFLRENGHGSPQFGGSVFKKLTGKKPSGRPQPMKLHAAKYTPPTPENVALANEYLAKYDKPKPSARDEFFGTNESATPGRATTLDSMRNSSQFDNDEPPF